MDRQSWLQGTLYSPSFEQDSCGFGLIAQMDDKPSHWLVSTAISSLACLTHRGAVAADGKSGDGCGLLFRKPDGFLRAVAAENGFTLGADYAAGLVFHSDDASLTRLQEAVEAQGLGFAGLREVPVNLEACGEYALRTLPKFKQVFVNAAAGMDDATFTRKLYQARRLAEKANQGDAAFYIPTLNPHVMSYKGLVTPDNLPVFYLDLKDERFASSLAVYHQRFSTNTWPQWKLAQPFRFVAHNGEINTLHGNRLWAKAREAIMDTPNLDMDAVRPIVQTDGSDSMSLDNMLEGLMMGGIDIFRAFRMLVPPAWQNVDSNDRDLRAFYEYNSMHMEPWDGPAGLVWTNGRYAGCALDRNGLRPARYVITKDRHLTIASEVGTWNYKPEDVVKKGRVKPGQIVAVDLQTGEFLDTETIDNRLKAAHPYRDWVKKNAQHLEIAEDTGPLAEMDASALLTYQKQFQLTFEERDQILRVLAADGQEAIGSMGDDTPMAVLSEKVRSPFDYLRQQFAQVTNPPIDPIREAIVMSLNTCFGPERNIFQESEDNARRLEVRSPVLSSDKFDALTRLEGADYKPAFFDISYEASQTSLKAAIEALRTAVLKSVTDDKTVIVVLSDKNIAKGRLPIPALFAVGAVHHALVDAGLRCKTNIIVETATARDPHHFACLIGYGATAVFPYLAYQTIKELVDMGQIDYPLAKATNNFRKGINKGLLKILSKMGISTIASYRGSQLFEGVGIGEEVVDLCLAGTVSRIGGANFADFEADQAQLNKFAFNPMRPIAQGGLLKYVFGEEYHAYNPDVVMQLQKAVNGGEYKEYLKYAELVNNRPVAMLRDLMELQLDPSKAIAIDEVESVEAILKRFDSAGMSLGALSPEAHEALAEGMNRLGGRSNSGEGGEDAARYGTVKMSKIKQVASGRFGVTPHYLVNAEVLQIKVAQGAKPGEGGQLPGDKVSPLIAKLRCSKPGISLISPPPHHDIYSIEDLAQLIFDLKQVNPAALVSVKLVAEPGVGTIAAGVAKAYADLITISGYDGGTGASPLASVKYAGTPFELGLTEAQQVLRANGLRGRVRVQADGGLKTGLDVIKAAMMGAESFGFGTGPMVALGCKYLRICHLNNCATGVATQEIKLRSKYFTGLPDMVVNYFTFIAQETREWMAKVGVRSMEELIGRTDLLKLSSGATERQGRLKLDVLLSQGDIPESAPRFCIEDSNPSFDKGELAEQMVKDAIAGILSKTPQRLEYAVRNVNRSIGARLSGEIAKAHGAAGLPADALHLKLNGSAGQSFGVWNANGLTMELEGDANDYAGKGMAGGKLVIYPPKASEFRSDDGVIVGNTCLYGATGGEFFAAGKGGERFAVRNSGATAIVEGVGDHGCEYMTGGVVIVLGETGYNFGAGMTGGFALVYDAQEKFAYRINNELIDINLINGESYGAVRAYLRGKLKEHAELTGSAKAQELLANFDEAVDYFWLVKPKAAKLDDLLKD
ncbi:glutamate synthase (NADPH/NADH) large chain [Andreprevotia lacus DSM 23236]|jgi:glutamate synthase (NADPH/NADH) large chain|uniref:Glutamate synthase [NADPH] large chain n=1 Tax=Andreprevotia lacus DSM 23236 TaxID=1121001 RepID=A0A1W1Y1P7_9NEIS|nr:glutamate synthase large subunit [Andreprevotia lacus]SMC29688.1 glutamate synthase (NADPH/NADH) large chain [Andreprevotia lacus DSM 23236]